VRFALKFSVRRHTLSLPLAVFALLSGAHAAAACPHCRCIFALRGKGGDERGLQELAEYKDVIKAAKQKAEEVSWLGARVRWKC
jgi:hypothetical protein